MNKFFYLTLLFLSATFSLYSQTNSILIVQPKGFQYKKIELGLKSELNKSISIKSIVSKNEAEITSSINNNSPGIVVLMGSETIKIWKKIQQKNKVNYQIPSIMIDNEFFGVNVDNNLNSCIITYETKLKQYVNRFVHLTGRNPLNIGVVFSSKSSSLAQSYQSEASELGVNIYAKSVVISDPENSIKSIVNNFKEHYHIDFMIILDDHNVINNQNINPTWVSLLAPLKIPVAVPSDYFYELEPRIGSFAIQPHYKEIGQVVASVINDAISNSWIIKQKSIYSDKSIFYYRNENGSISKQDQIGNQLIVSYHPKTVTTPVLSAVTAPPAPQPKSPEPEVSSNAVQQIASTVIEKTIAPPPSEPTASIKEVVREKLVASISSSNVSSKKNSQPSTKSATESKHKKDKNDQKDIRNNTDKTPLQPTVHQENRTVNENVFKFNATNYDQYDVMLTADTTNVFKNLSPDFAVLGVGRLGDILRVSSEDSFWFCVDFSGTPGYVSKTQANRISKRDKDYISEPTWINYKITGIIIISVMVVLFFIYILLKSRRHKINGINCLLISKNDKLVKYSNINNNSISLIKYLKNCGFHIINLKSLNQASTFLHLNIPEIICVDWKLEADIQDKICQILRYKMLTADFLLIFYNVATPSSIKKGECFDDRTFFFGKNLTISDLNSVLSFVKTKSDSSEQSSENLKSCLEGKITEETLSEIFQMMETNKKTGCLLVENHRPFGMIFFEDGMITFAVTNSLTAEEAVFDILSMKHGRFQFLPGKTPATRQMQLDTLAVLMERAKLDDEVQINPVGLT